MTNEVGRVIGTEDSHPLEFWVGVGPESYLQLDDIVAVETPISGHPQHDRAKLYGIVDIVRAEYEGAQFHTDVFRTDVLPVGIATTAHVSVTRVEPEIFVPPLPGRPAHRAVGSERDTALYFDQMKNKFAAGLSRDNQIVWGNLDFLDGSRGAHINISGISGVATKTSCALFLLKSLFTSATTRDSIGPNTRALIFNVKGEDLLHLDRANVRLRDSSVRASEESRYAALGVPMEPFSNIALWAPPKAKGFEAIPDVSSRQDDSITTYFWSLRRFCEESLLPFLFADAGRETSQLQFAVTIATNYLRRAVESSSEKHKGWITLEDKKITSYYELVEFIATHEELIFPPHVRIAPPTIHAFIRRLYATVPAVGHLIRKTDDREEEDSALLDWGRKQLNVVHVAPLQDIAVRFVVGVTLSHLMQDKITEGREPLVFVVLDELNKYAPNEGWSPIKEVILDISERGRSLGVILIGAQQTASEVERRVVANASFRIAGRLDAAEAQRAEYGFLTGAAKARASLLKPGTMFIHQPEIPVPLLVQLPYPAWATRQEEVDKQATRSKWL